MAALYFEISKSGLLAEERRLNASVHNTANLSTDGFRPQVASAQERSTGGVDVRVDTVQVSEEAQKALAKAEGVVPQPENDVNLVQETVNQIAAGASFRASATALKAQDRTIGTLLDAVG